MGPHGVEAVLVCGVGQGDLLAVRGGVGEASIGGDGGALGALSFGSPAFLSGDTVAGFVTEIIDFSLYESEIRFHRE